MKKLKGYTLIELMIVISVLSILVAIAYPAYNDQVRKTRRSDGKVGLTSAAQALERCFTQTNAYNDAACTFSANSPENWYAITVVRTATTFTLTATPQGDQVNDDCLNLTLTHTGQKGTSSAETDCW